MKTCNRFFRLGGTCACGTEAGTPGSDMRVCVPVRVRAAVSWRSGLVGAIQRRRGKRLRFHAQSPTGVVGLISEAEVEF